MCCYLTYKYLMQYSITAAWHNHRIKKLSFICNPKEKPSHLEPSQVTEGEQNLLITKHIALRVPFNKFNGYSKFWFFAVSDRVNLWFHMILKSQRNYCLQKKTLSQGLFDISVQYFIGGGLLVESFHLLLFIYPLPWTFECSQLKIYNILHNDLLSL